MKEMFCLVGLLSLDRTRPRQNLHPSPNFLGAIEFVTLNSGDASTLNITSFNQLYFSIENYTLDVLCDYSKLVRDKPVANNPYFFPAV
jgi:hypothetical protein